jgi:glycosyltransferase involved in cell wall biosynthesis
MRILLFSSFSSSWNGVRPEAELFIGIAKKGHQVYVASQTDTPYAKRFRDEGLTVIDCYPSGKICLKTIFKLRSIIKENQIDIVYATNSRTIPNAAFACINLPVKLINYRGASRGLYRHDPSAYLTHLHPRVDAICCNAEAVRQDVIKRVWKNKNRVKTIYKGHDVDWFSDPKAELSCLNIPENAFVVTCAANARPCKGISVLLDACQFLQDIPNLYILIVGQDVDSPQYIDQKNNTPLAQNIILTGFRTDVPQIIAASDIYIQPSTSREGMAKTIIEAMAQGIPPVATDIGGTCELIVDGQSGFIVPTNAPKAIADKICKLYHDPDLMKSMGKAAKKRISENFSVQKSIDDYLAFFQKILL